MSGEKKPKKGINGVKVGAGMTMHEFKKQLKQQSKTEKPDVQGVVDFGPGEIHSRHLSPQNTSAADIKEAYEAHKATLDIFIYQFLKPCFISLLNEGVIFGCGADQIKIASKTSVVAFEYWYHNCAGENEGQQ